ncbi:TetR/AcrR family transcriptional regulator [Hahella ganghwensis]|uniref:TetR/AcrR family transcriptional regulator n=1 Tax=Hahella ganghwensis TaxID=286420 RepID=UPI00036443D8|nr:TetR family transcriptional regulator [Hahella ganghwensis]
MTASRREHLLQTALQLFNEHGFNATGIDRVQAASGVSKTTMYKHFKSKDELIQAVLELRQKEFDQWLRRRVDEVTIDRYPEHPAGKILALFDILDEWFNSENFFGCNFINASAEFCQKSHPIHRMASQCKLSMLEFITQLLPPETDQPEELARDICLLIDGAIVSAHTACAKEAARRAKNILLMLLERR